MSPSPLADTTNTTSPETEAALHQAFILGRLAPKLATKQVEPILAGEKRKDAPAPKISDRDKTYSELGRLFGRISDPFADVSHVVAMGIKNDTADTEQEAKNQNVVFKNSECKQSLDTWIIWTKRCPCFCKDVLETQELSSGRSISLLKQINNKVTDGINAIRAVDTSSLKSNILKYLLENLNDTLTPAIVKKNKSDRGWNHPITARLLCPLAWEANNETFSAIQDGQKVVTADYYPRFLYPSNRLYDRDDLETGLLQSFILFRVAKHILMGPSAALETPGYHRGKRGNAQINGITTMTPHIIAYIVVQTRHALSTQLNWSAVEGAFNYTAFYWNIVHIFDDNEGQGILKAFDYQVFGPRSEPAQEQEEAISELVRIKEERARKRARMGNGNGLPVATA